MGAPSFAFFAKGGIPHLQTQWDFDLGGAFDLSRPLRRLRPNCLYHPIHDHLPHLPPSLLCRDVHCRLLSSSLRAYWPCNQLLRFLRSDSLLFLLTLRVHVFTLHFITLPIEVLFKPLRTPHAGPVHIAAVDHNFRRIFRLKLCIS